MGENRDFALFSIPQFISLSTSMYRPLQYGKTETEFLFFFCMYVCIYVYIYIYIYVCVCVCVCVCGCVYVCIHKWANVNFSNIPFFVHSYTFF